MVLSVVTQIGFYGSSYQDATSGQSLAQINCPTGKKIPCLLFLIQNNMSKTANRLEIDKS